MTFGPAVVLVQVQVRSGSRMSVGRGSWPWSGGRPPWCRPGRPQKRPGDRARGDQEVQETKRRMFGLLIVFVLLGIGFAAGYATR
jgi:hypothetical protein